MTDPALGLRLESGSTAPFEQIREQITVQVADGALIVGTRLPPVRALAETLGVAAGTVARAYKELEAAGVVETRGRSGTVVARGADGVGHEAQLAAVAFAERMRVLGVAPDEALRTVRTALGR